MELGVGIRRIATLTLLGLLALAILSGVLVASLRWVNPPTSAFMVRHWVSGWWEGRERPWIHHEWEDLERVAPVVPLAVVAAEDQRFPSHGGFDLVELKNAWRDYRAGGRLRGASTLSQQVAKNLFLWPGKSLVRKAIEAWFTWLIELTWPKQRILEIYLNVAQFGPSTFGVSAAAWRYFHRPAVALTKKEASMLAAVLPNPERYRLDNPSSYVLKRAAWVRKQMSQLGPGYLDDLLSPGDTLGARVDPHDPERHFGALGPAVERRGPVELVDRDV